MDIAPNTGKPFFQNDLLDVLRLGRGEKILKASEKPAFRSAQIAQLKEVIRISSAWLEQLQGEEAENQVSGKMQMGVPDGTKHWHAERGLRDDEAALPVGVEESACWPVPEMDNSVKTPPPMKAPGVPSVISVKAPPAASPAVKAVSPVAKAPAKFTMQQLGDWGGCSDSE